MSVSDLSASTQNYLKTIWGLGEWTSDPVTPSLIADRMGRKLSSVSEAVRKLADQGFLHHAPYGAVELTDLGRAHALAMVRRHRLIESFLVSALGYSWDQVHDEAEHLEHAVSDFMVERIDALLGFPDHDPHGDPIPTADGVVTLPDARQLTAVGAAGEVVVRRISDADPTLLQFFEGQGITIGARMSVQEGPQFSEALEVRVLEEVGPDGSTDEQSIMGPTITLGRTATDALYVAVG